jgi:hypothetical protein
MADEHGPDAPDADGAKPKTLAERTAAAIEAAFDEQIKMRFGALSANEYGDGGLGTALGLFKKGLGDLKEAREKALIVVKEVFG